VEEKQTRKKKRNLIPGRKKKWCSLLGSDAFTCHSAMTLSRSPRGERLGYHFTFIESSVDIAGLQKSRMHQIQMGLQAYKMHGKHGNSSAKWCKNTSQQQNYVP